MPPSPLRPPSSTPGPPRLAPYTLPSHLPPRPAPPDRSRLARRAELAALALILLLAMGLRLYRLEAIPPGLTHDEAGHGHDAAAVLRGFRPIYFTVGYGREPAFDYFNAGLFALAGQTISTLRASAAFWGLAAILAAYLWARLAFGPAAALMTAGLMAVSFWPLAVSRQALRSGMLPALFALAACAWWRYYYTGRNSFSRRPSEHSVAGWRKRVSSGLKLALFPLLLAATFYTYLPARGLWIVFPLFLLYLALSRRITPSPLHPPPSTPLPPPPSTSPASRLPPSAPRTLLALAAAGLLALPLFYYLWTHPGAEQRLDMLDAPLQALASGDLGPAFANLRDALLMFFWPGKGDHFLAYTLPGKPIFDPVVFILFALGLGLTLRRWREPASAFTLLWLTVGIGPSLLTGPEAATTRSLGAQPVIYLFPALAVDALAQYFTTKARRHEEQGLGVRGYELRITHYALRIAYRLLPIALFTAAGLALLAGLTYRDYFLRWGELPEVRAAYQRTLMSETAYLDAQPEGGAAVLSSVYPGAAHDPYIAEMALARPDLRLRWADGRQALIFPSVPAARLIAPASAPLDPVFQAWLGAPRLRVGLRPDDLDPYYDVYQWQPLEAYRQALAGAGPGAVSLGGDDLRRLPVNFGDAVELEGYQWLEAPARAGQTATLLTFWRVTDPAAVGPRVPPAFQTEAALFVHVLDAGGGIVAQQDRLDAPSWDWQAGDRVAQLFRLPLPADLAPGLYSVETGLYNRSDGVRLPVLQAGGAPAGDHVLLAPLEVAGR